jgi:hypothetical protein
MPTTIKGGSSVITIDGSSTNTFQLTGLDANGKVLTQINVKVIAGATPQATLNITLPLIASINGRTIQFNINSNDYAGDVTLAPAVGNTINGIASVISQTTFEVVTTITTGSATNWILPDLKF